MAELFLQMSLLLDGFVEDRDGVMDWFAGDQAFDQILTATGGMIDGIILGKKAHDRSSSGRVRPNYLSGLFRGITLVHTRAVASVPGVEVSAR